MVLNLPILHYRHSHNQGEILNGWLLPGLRHHLHHAHADALYGVGLSIVTGPLKRIH